jgi:large subunit GTPase 1
MPQAKSKNAVGLGNTLMNDRFGKGKGSDRRKGAGITRINHATGEEVGDPNTGSWLHTKT